eukprot:8845463-Heterocapsa_arctica.AAC.1
MNLPDMVTACSTTRTSEISLLIPRMHPISPQASEGAMPMMAVHPHVHSAQLLMVSMSCLRSGLEFQVRNEFKRAYHRVASPQLHRPTRGIGDDGAEQARPRDAWRRSC